MHWMQLLPGQMHITINQQLQVSKIGVKAKASIYLFIKHIASQLAIMIKVSMMKVKVHTLASKKVECFASKFAILFHILQLHIVQQCVIGQQLLTVG